MSTNPQPDMDWQRHANCVGVDPELFFPQRGEDTRSARKVCFACVVREECAEFAIVNGEKFGIWGGLSERERRRIRRQRGQSLKLRREADMVEHTPKPWCTGTRTSYNRGCRCDRCRDADRARERQRPQQRTAG